MYFVLSNTFIHIVPVSIFFIPLQKVLPYVINHTGMTSQRTKRKKVPVFFLVYMVLTFALTGANPDADEPFNARLHVEIGIDSLERSYYRPEFRFEFPLSIGTAFTEISYYQVVDSRLRGRIDYWVTVGLEKTLNRKLKLEIGLNHMCRHIPSRDNPVVFDLNEVMGKLWLQAKHYKVGFGGGVYSGGSAHYKHLFQLDAEVPRIFDSEVSFSGRVKLVDFEEILHEAGLFFSLSKSTDLFIRNSRHYLLKNRTYVGIRMKSVGKVEKYIDSIRMSADIYPFYKSHKLMVEGEYRLVFFRKPGRRVAAAIKFTAPILRGDAFFNTFFPEAMIYPISLEYRQRIKKSLFIAWYTLYHLNMPLDIDGEFAASLSTGISLKNQWDFERLEKPVRFDVFAGYNFKHSVETGAKLGVSLLEYGGLTFGSDLRIEYARERFCADLKLFMDYGNAVTFRPFVGVERIDHTASPRPTITRFTFGFHFFRWFN